MPLRLEVLGPNAQLVEVLPGEDSQGEQCMVLGDGKAVFLYEPRLTYVGIYPPETILGQVAMVAVFPTRRGGSLGWQPLPLGQPTIIWRKDRAGVEQRGIQVTPLPLIDFELDACRFDDF